MCIMGYTTGVFAFVGCVSLFALYVYGVRAILFLLILCLYFGISDMFFLSWLELDDALFLWFQNHPFWYVQVGYPCIYRVCVFACGEFR